MYKVYLAVGNEGVEKYIKSQKPLLEKMLNDTVNFIGATVYKEGALQGVKDYHPDVIILREGLHGTLDILDLVYKIRLESSGTRIILITKTREVGDAFLAQAVQLGVYDLLIGDKISVKDLLKKIVYPTKFVDAAHFIPKVTIDEKTNKKIFSAPDVDALVKQRVDEIAQTSVIPETVPTLPVTEQTPAIQLDTNKSDMINILKDPENAKVVVAGPKEEFEPELVATYSGPVSAPVAPVAPMPTSIENSFAELNVQKEEPVQVPNIASIPNDIEDDDFDDIPVPNPLSMDFGKKEDPTPAPVPAHKEYIPTPMPVAPIVVQPEPAPVGFAPDLNLEKTDVEVERFIPPAEEPPAHLFAEQPSFIPPEPQTFTPVQEEIHQAQQPPVEDIPQTPPTPVMDEYYSSEIKQIQPIDGIPIPTQNPYTVGPNTPTQTINNTPSKRGFTLFNKKSNQRTIPAQIITFWGGGDGVGNSQIAFNTAIALANKGYHVIYVDLNDNFSSVESMMQLGFEDLGIDTMLRNIEDNHTEKVGHAIGSIAKILPFTDKRDFLYKTYTNMPSSLNFAFFSQHCFEGRTGIQYNIEKLKDLNLMFLMDFGYDVIILDAPTNVKNRATQLALAYANKVFVTLNQDKTVLSRTLKQMKFLSYNRVNVRDKSYFIVNRFENNDFSFNNLSNFIAMNLQYEKLEMMCIPNMSKEFVNSVYNGLPIILSTKNKEFLKTMNDIVTIIEN